jgi:hypothetical protein
MRLTLPRNSLHLDQTTMTEPLSTVLVEDVVRLVHAKGFTDWNLGNRERGMSWSHTSCPLGNHHFPRFITLKDERFLDPTAGTKLCRPLYAKFCTRTLVVIDLSGVP